MKRTRNVSLFSWYLLHSPSRHNITSSSSPLASSALSRLRFFSSENDSSNENSKPVPETSLANPVKKDVSDSLWMLRTSITNVIGLFFLSYFALFYGKLMKNSSKRREFKIFFLSFFVFFFLIDAVYPKVVIN